MVFNDTFSDYTDHSGSSGRQVCRYAQGLSGRLTMYEIYF